MKEQETVRQKNGPDPRKGCPLRFGGDRTCKLNGTPFCFPEGFSRQDLETLITQCGRATSQREYPNRKLVYRNSR